MTAKLDRNVSHILIDGKPTTDHRLKSTIIQTNRKRCAYDGTKLPKGSSALSFTYTKGNRRVTVYFCHYGCFNDWDPR